MYFKKNRGKWEILVDTYSTHTLTPCQMEILQVKNIMIRTNNLLQYFISRLEIAKKISKSGYRTVDSMQGNAQGEHTRKKQRRER